MQESVINLIGTDMSERLAANIGALAERRRREARSAPLSARIAGRITAFAGSMNFVLLHFVFYGFWIAANIGLLPGVSSWDESFVILAMEASVEAIFLSTFVLINQNRQAKQADRSADLDLHVGLLVEDELSTLARIVGRIADRLDVPVDSDALDEITKNVDPERVLDALGEVDAHQQDDAPAMNASTAS